MAMPTLSIIIVKHNCDDYLKKCLCSIGKNKNHEVIVVDNDKENVGFAAGCNKGAKKAKGKYLFFLNPDTLVLTNSLTLMINFMEKNPQVGIIGPKIYSDSNKTQQLSFSRFPGILTSLFVYSPLKNLWKDNPFWKRFIEVDKIKSKKPIEVEAVSGAALMIRKEVFDKIGGFDTNFFFYFEDNDICRSVQKSGKQVFFFPQAEIIHFGGKSSLDQTQTKRHFKNSRLYFFKKNYGLVMACLLEGTIRPLEFVSEIV